MLTAAAGLVAIRGPVPAAGASPSSCPTVQPGDIPVANDIDGDGIADTVVGGRGAVDVRYGGTGRASALVTSSDLPAADSARSFGDAVAYGDVDNDGCADVLVGEPGANRVVVLYGPVHSSAPRLSVIAEPDPQPGDRFGAAVAVGFGDELRGECGALSKAECAENAFDTRAELVKGHTAHGCY